MEQDTDVTTGGGAITPTPLGDILGSTPRDAPSEPAGRPEPVAQPAAEPTGEKPAADGAAARDDRGRFAPKDGEAKAAPPAAEQPPQTVPLSAVLEERKKRQAIEARMRELEARLAPSQPPAAPQPPAQPEVPLEDLMFQDPARFIEAVRAPLEQQLVQTRIAMSERVARQQPDYADAEAALLAYVEANPSIRPQVANVMRQHPDPAGWALEQGRALLHQQRWGQVIQQFGSPEAYAESLRAAPQPAPAVAPASPSPVAPPASLAGARSAGPRSGPAPFTGARPLSEILGTRR